MTDRVVHRARLFPSCNLTLVRGDHVDLLVDSGAWSDLDETLALLTELDVDPARLRVFTTHWHSDHAGGNGGLQERFGTPVIAHEREGELVRAGDPEVCASDYLDQPVPAYRVDEVVADGDVLDLGGVRLRVVPARGHSLGQAALFDEESRLLIAGDALLARDVPWINPFLDGADALDEAVETMHRIAALGAARGVAGHGPEIDDVAGAVARSLARLEEWRRDPEAMAWHGTRRVLAYALMINGGFAEDALLPYLLARRWVHDFAPLTGLGPEEFAARLQEGMIGRGAEWRDGRLVSTVPHRALGSRTAP